MERQQETERNTGRDYKSERYRVTRERRAQRKKYFKNGALGTMYIYIYIHSHMKYQMFFFFFSFMISKSTTPVCHQSFFIAGYVYG